MNIIKLIVLCRERVGKEACHFTCIFGFKLADKTEYESSLVCTAYFRLYVGQSDIISEFQ